MPLSLGFSLCYTITQSSVYSLCKFLLRDISVNSYLSRVKPQESQVQLLNNATLVLHVRKNYSIVWHTESTLVSNSHCCSFLRRYITEFHRRVNIIDEHNYHPIRLWQKLIYQHKKTEMKI